MPAEERLWNAFREGREVDLRPPAESGSGTRSGSRPEVRAEVIAAILCSESRPGPNARLALAGARITGRLDLSYLRLEFPLVLRDCCFDEPFVLAGARLAALTLDDSQLPGIDAQDLELAGELGLRRVSVTETVNLTGARLQRGVQLEGAHLGSGPECAVALDADRAVIDGSLACHDRFIADGTVSMVGARVTGSLRLDDATISGAGDPKLAFQGDGMTIGGELSAERLRADGEIRLIECRVASAVELHGARLVNAGGVALRMDRAEISSSVFCDDGFAAVGEVRAIGAYIKGTVYFDDAEIGAPAPAAGAGARGRRPQPALHLVRTRIDGDLACWEKFVAHGPVVLTRSSVAGEFQVDTTKLEGQPAADLTNARFGTLTITGRAPGGRVDLTRAKVDIFDDDPVHWDGDLVLADFEYTSIPLAGVTPKQREDWLSRALGASQRKTGSTQKVYLPQPYEQLAEAYRRAGDDRAARRIQLAKNRRRNDVTQWDRWYSKIANIVQDIMIGYGYAYWRALIWLVALFVLGAVLFRYGAPPHAIAHPSHSFTLSDSVGYTLNLLIPITSLDERQVWQSSNGAGEVAAAALVVVGWILAVTVFAGMARVLQRS
jgi:hypothetical protein